MTMDLTTVFDTLDHGTLLSHLEEHVGIKGAALMLKKYLTDRSFSVQKGNFSSVPAPKGRFQASLYMLPLGSIFRNHNILFLCNADDVQIYLPLWKHSKDSLIPLLACLADIESWMSQSQLNLNENKSEFIVFGVPKGSLNLMIISSPPKPVPL